MSLLTERDGRTGKQVWTYRPCAATLLELVILPSGRPTQGVLANHDGDGNENVSKQEV